VGWSYQLCPPSMIGGISPMTPYGSSSSKCLRQACSLSQADCTIPGCARTRASSPNGSRSSTISTASSRPRSKRTARSSPPAPQRPVRQGRCSRQLAFHFQPISAKKRPDPARHCKLHRSAKCGANKPAPHHKPLISNIISKCTVQLGPRRPGMLRRLRSGAVPAAMARSTSRRCMIGSSSVKNAIWVLGWDRLER
jgi:hypothetical protein